jgi:hypothetical protein
VEIYSAIPLTPSPRRVSNNGEGLYYCRHLGDVSQDPFPSGAFAEAEVTNRHKESTLEHFPLCIPSGTAALLSRNGQRFSVPDEHRFNVKMPQAA